MAGPVSNGWGRVRLPVYFFSGPTTSAGAHMEETPMMIARWPIE